jgi:hypothetical protein
MRLEWVYTSAHYGSTVHEGVWHAYDITCNRGKISDALGRPVGTELMCEYLKFKQNRVWLQVSRDKHAIYPSTHICNDHATLVWLTTKQEKRETWGEFCGGGGEYLFDAYNVGEPDRHLFDDLASKTDWIGLTQAQRSSPEGLFPGERVYSGTLNNPKHPDWFCGGIDSPPDSDCSEGTIGKALNDELFPILRAKLGPTTYRIRIKTADRKGAGTDAAIHITLYAADGTQYTEELDGSFEEGSVDVFHIGNLALNTYFGDIVAIALRKDAKESNPDLYVAGGSLFAPEPNWYVQEVEVENKVTGKKWIFKIDEEIMDSREHIYD